MERYEIVKDIGSGNFGVAKLVRDKWTHEFLAVKFIERGHKVPNLPFQFISFFLRITRLITMRVSVLFILTQFSKGHILMLNPMMVIWIYEISCLISNSEAVSYVL